MSFQDQEEKSKVLIRKRAAGVLPYYVKDTARREFIVRRMGEMFDSMEVYEIAAAVSSYIAFTLEGIDNGYIVSGVLDKDTMKVETLEACSKEDRKEMHDSITRAAYHLVSATVELEKSLRVEKSVIATDEDTMH